MPDGLVYPTYLAAPKESRFAGLVNYERHWGWLLDLEAGGRVGLFRYGTASTSRPEGWQLDLEGAAFPRLDLEHEEDLIAADFRGGLPLTFGAGPWRGKLAVYHLSSHLGDEFLLRFPEASRINYSRNALVLGGTYFWTEAWSIYGEAEWAFLYRRRHAPLGVPVGDRLQPRHLGQHLPGGALPRCQWSVATGGRLWR